MAERASATPAETELEIFLEEAAQKVKDSLIEIFRSKIGSLPTVSVVDNGGALIIKPCVQICDFGDQPRDLYLVEEGIYDLRETPFRGVWHYDWIACNEISLNEYLWFGEQALSELGLYRAAEAQSNPPNLPGPGI